MSCHCGTERIVVLGRHVTQPMVESFSGTIHANPRACTALIAYGSRLTRPKHNKIHHGAGMMTSCKAHMAATSAQPPPQRLGDIMAAQVPIPLHCMCNWSWGAASTPQP